MAEAHGHDLVEQFLATGEVATVVQVDGTAERDHLAAAARSYVRRCDRGVWVRKIAPTELLLVDLTQAPPEVLEVYRSARRRRARGGGQHRHEEVDRMANSGSGPQA